MKPIHFYNLFTHSQVTNQSKNHASPLAERFADAKEQTVNSNILSNAVQADPEIESTAKLKYTYSSIDRIAFQPRSLSHHQAVFVPAQSLSPW